MDHDKNLYQVPRELTEDVFVMRKVEILLEVLTALDNANVPEAYAVKMRVVDKLDRIIDSL